MRLGIEPSVPKASGLQPGDTPLCHSHQKVSLGNDPRIRVYETRGLPINLTNQVLNDGLEPPALRVSDACANRCANRAKWNAWGMIPEPIA